MNLSMKSRKRFLNMVIKIWLKNNWTQNLRRNQWDTYMYDLDGQTNFDRLSQLGFQFF